MFTCLWLFFVVFWSEALAYYRSPTYLCTNVRKHSPLQNFQPLEANMFFQASALPHLKRSLEHRIDEAEEYREERNEHFKETEHADEAEIQMDASAQVRLLKEMRTIYTAALRTMSSEGQIATYNRYKAEYNRMRNRTVSPLQRCFWVFWEDIQFSQFGDACAQHGMMAAMIATSTDNNAIHNQLNQLGLLDGVFWIGARYYSRHRAFRWVYRHARMQYTNVPPNLRVYDRNCMQGYGNNGDFYWRFGECTETHPYICERYEVNGEAVPVDGELGGWG